MKVTNQIIIALGSAGVQNITANSISAAQAYRVIKFRRALSRAVADYCEKERELISECGLDVKDGRINGKEDALHHFALLRSELYKDSVEIESAAIPFEDWHALKKENQCLCSPAIEDSLEGLLWVAPED